MKEHSDLQHLAHEFLESGRWANLDISFNEIIKENKALVRNLEKYSPESAVPMLAALLTLPQYQSICIRLETLVSLAVSKCKGRKVAGSVDVCRWLHMIQKSKILLAEDPADDVFVHLVRFEGEGYRIIGGIWENAGFYLQRILDVVESMPNQARFSQWKKTVKAVLVLSDLVCEQSGLRRYEAGSVASYDSISAEDLPSSSELLPRTIFSAEDLKNTGVDLDMLDDLILDFEDRTNLQTQQVEKNGLLWQPLLPFRDGQICITLPTAIGLAIREFVFSNCLNNGLENQFDQKLRQSYARLLSSNLLLQNAEHVPLKQIEDQFHCQPRAIKIDRGYFVALFFVVPSIRTHPIGTFGMAVRTDEAIETTIHNTIQDVISELSSRTDFHRGQIIYIACDWGQGSLTRIWGETDPNWRHNHISAADFDCLRFAEHMDFPYLWKILDGLEIAEAQGVEFLNLSGLLNVIGWVQSRGGSFLPHDELIDVDVSPLQPLQLPLPTNALREVRILSYQRYDIHFVRDNTGKSHTIQRVHPFGQFDNTALVPLYSSVSEFFEQDVLTSVYVSNYQIWTTLTTTGESNLEIQRHLLTMVRTWLERVGKAVEEVYPKSSPKRQVCRVDVEFEDPLKQTNRLVKPTLDELGRYCRTVYLEEANAAKVTFASGFITGFGVSENIAERMFVRQLIRSITHLFNLPNKSSASLEEKVVKNKDARSFHRIHGRGSLDALGAFLPSHRIEPISVELSSIQLGLGRTAQDDWSKRNISGKQACSKFLNELVRKLGEDIVKDLQQFELWATVRTLILNIERASQDQSFIMRTSASVLGLHGNKDRVNNYIVRELARLGNIIATCRTLIEIAICTCPVDSGRFPADMELSTQMARARLLMQYGGRSDAIHFNVLKPQIQISSVGQILSSHELEETVLEPMAIQHQTDRFLATVSQQHENYEPPVDSTDANRHFDQDFVNIWKQDMGFDLEQGKRILEVLMNVGLSNEALCFRMNEQTYFAELKNAGIPKQAAGGFLNQLTMESRCDWFEPPKGFKLNDIKPWKFGRKYAFLMRPIIRISSNRSYQTELIICPSAVERSLKYVVGQSYRGGFHRNFFPHPKRWDKWLNRVREGHSFTQRVAAELEQLGWSVLTNIKLTKLLRKNLGRNFGDIDVLAWRTNEPEVLIVECKDLASARNLTEIAYVLSQYQGTTVNGERDKLRKHLDRIDILTDHTSLVARFTQKDRAAIKSCLIFSSANPVYYASIPALEGTFVGTVEELIFKYN